MLNWVGSLPLETDREVLVEEGAFQELQIQLFVNRICAIDSLKLTKLFMQAAKILANLIVMGGGILARAVVQAYRQALTSKLPKL
jgi:hypothetical protein